MVHWDDDDDFTFTDGEGYTFDSHGNSLDENGELEDWVTCRVLDLGNGAECKIYEDDGVDGDKHWRLNGKRHRTDGPAIERSYGSKYWYINDERHRIDGPAVEYADGRKEWWINDIQYSEEEFNQVKEVLWAV